jgi:hypothetical protein
VQIQNNNLIGMLPEPVGQLLHRKYERAIERKMVAQRVLDIAETVPVQANVAGDGNLEKLRDALNPPRVERKVRAVAKLDLIIGIAEQPGVEPDQAGAVLKLIGNVQTMVGGELGLCAIEIVAVSIVRAEDGREGDGLVRLNTVVLVRAGNPESMPFNHYRLLVINAANSFANPGLAQMKDNVDYPLYSAMDRRLSNRWIYAAACAYASR